MGRVVHRVHWFESPPNEKALYREAWEKLDEKARAAGVPVTITKQLCRGTLLHTQWRPAEVEVSRYEGYRPTSRHVNGAWIALVARDDSGDIVEMNPLTLKIGEYDKH